MPDSTLPLEVSARTRLRILHKHAEGGLGQVAVALDEELGREIAFKEIQPQYADIADARDRFVREAEITGGLEHPGIVPVYGVGRYDNGRPFYVMQFIQGDSLSDAITAFHAADKPTRDPGQRKLALQKLLGRFLDVCHAVGYAHSRGVLHRDLKPENIMLGDYGETLVVDWGLAKATGREVDPTESGEAVFIPKSGGGGQGTRHGSSIGTPAYMSPEQAAGRIDELAPATDIYALGATLYAVLTGRPPIEEADTDLILAKVIGGDFPHPREVNRSIAKPLEAICLKAMANEPADRYASTAALANDIERYLADERVAAHREGWLERAARWGRRYRAFARAAAGSLVVITAISIAFALVADNLRSRAVRAEADTSTALDERTEALNKETAARKEADEVRERFIGAFRSPDPAFDGGDVKVVDVLDRFVVELERDSDMSPTLRATLTSTIGQTYSALGRYNEALPLHEESLRLREANLDPDHPDTLTSMNNLGLVYGQVGKLDQALQLHKETLNRRRAKLGPDHPDALVTMNCLAAAFVEAGKLDLAIPLFKKVLALQKATLGSDHPRTLTSLNNLALAFNNAGKLGRALPLYEEILKLRKAKLGPDHPDTLASMNNLARAYQSAGKLDAALPLFEETLRLMEATLGPDHRNTLTLMNNLAAAYSDAGRPGQVLPLLREALALRKAKLGLNHPDTLMSMNNLAVAYHHMGKLDEALPLYEETLELRKAKLGTNHAYTLASMHNLAMAYRKAGKLDQATPLLVETLKLKKVELGPDHPSTLNSMNSLAAVHSQAEDYPQAARIFRESLQLRRRRFPDHWMTFNNAAALGTVLAKLEKHEEAELLLLEGIEGMDVHISTIPPVYRRKIAERIASLIELYEAWGKPEESAKWRERLANPDGASPRSAEEPPVTESSGAASPPP